MKETVLKKDFKSLFSILLSMLILILVGILMIIDPRKSLDRTVGILMVLFFTFAFIYICIDFLKHKDFLVLNEYGFINNSNVYSKKMELILWESDN